MCAELGAGLFPNINTRVRTPGKSSLHPPRKRSPCSASFGEGWGAVPGTGWL